METIGQRVLVAEDDRDFRGALVVALATAGYDVAESHDGVELLDQLEATPAGFFRIVIADQRMPGLLGLECLARAGARAPFVLVSGLDDPRFREAAVKLGAVAILQKPVDLAALLALVAAVLSSEDARRLRVGADLRPHEPPRGHGAC